MKEVKVSIKDLASVIEEKAKGTDRTRIVIEGTENLVELQIGAVEIIIVSEKLKDSILEAVCSIGMKKFTEIYIDNEFKEGLNIEFPKLRTNRIGSFGVRLIGNGYGTVILNGLIDGIKYTESGKPSSHKRLYIEICSNIDNIIANTEDSGSVILNIREYSDEEVRVGSIDISNRELFHVHIELSKCQRINMDNCTCCGMMDIYRILRSVGEEIYIRKLRNFDHENEAKRGPIDGEVYRECDNGVIVRADKESYKVLVREEGAFSSVAKTVDEIYKARNRASKIGCELPDYLKYVLVEDDSL